MNWWEVLGVDSTANLEQVRAAYLELLKSNKPEENPEGFKRLRDAFEQANHYFENPDLIKTQDGSNNPMQPWVDNYCDFESRIDLESWQKLIDAQRELADSKIFTQVALGLFDFFLNNPYLPAPIWKLLDGYFGWQNNAERLVTYFSEDAVRYVLSRVEYSKWLPGIHTVRFPKTYGYEQTNAYFYQRDQVYRCLRNSETCSAELSAALLNLLQEVKDEEAFLMLLKVHERQGDFAGQFNVAKHYRAGFPDSADAQESYFHALYGAGQQAKALEYFQTTLQEKNSSADILKVAAMCAKATGEMQLAVQLYDKTISICAWDYEAHLHQYLIHLAEIKATGNPVLLIIEQAKVEIFRGYSDQALALLEGAAKQFVYTAEPSCIQGLEKLSLALLRFNAFAQLMDLLSPVIKIETNNHVLLFCLAEAYRALFKPQKALDLLSRIDQSVPVLWSKSSVLLDLKRHQQALDVCQTLLNQVPNDWMLLQRIGRCLEGLAKRSEALAHYQKVLELRPEDFSSYCVVMDLAMALGKVDVLRTTFQQLSSREIATHNVLDYWGTQINNLSG